MSESMTHSRTRHRLNVQAQLGRDVSAFGESVRMATRGEATQQLVDQRRDRVRVRISELVEAAQSEGYDEGAEVEP